MNKGWSRTDGVHYYNTDSAVVKRLEHMRAYERAIAEKLVIEFCYLRILYSGLPRSGKTSFLRRILGDIINISQAQSKGEGEQPSTGVAEDGGHVVLRRTCLDVGGFSPNSVTSWFVLKDLEEEASMFVQWIRQELDNLKGSTPPRSTDALDKQDTATLEASPVQPVLSQPPPPPPPSPPQSIGSNLSEILSVFRKAMEKEDWDKARHVLEGTTLLINVDMGGHTEFLDMQAPLVRGSSLNLLFRRLTDELDKEFRVYYTDQNGISSEEEDSIVSVENVIFQTLSCIMAFSTRVPEEEEVEEEEEEEEELGIGAEELQDVLWFLHDMGFLL